MRTLTCTKVRIDRKDLIADDVVALTLSEADGHPLPRWAPGAHIDLMLGEHTRQYSLCGDPGDDHRWRVAVRRESGGRGGSLEVHDRLHADDMVQVRGPRNHFPLRPAAQYLFIAGGIGITPILPMVAAAEAAEARWRLWYTGRRRSGMPFLDELAAYGERVSVHPRDETGRIDLDALLGDPQPDTLVYCCGPGPLIEAVTKRCAAWPPQSLHVERFAAGSRAEPAADAPLEVVLARSGRTVTATPDRSILSAVEQAGVPVLSACAEGVCGTCETSVLDGLPDHRDSILTEAERRANDRMMICVSRSHTPRLVLDL